MILYLDRIINYQKKDPSSRITCINEIQGFMNRESLVLKALRNAIRNDSLKVYIQPIWSVKNKRFEKGEILARLIDEHLGFISLSEFIPLAEEWNLINDVTKQITYKTIQAMKKYDFKSLGVDNLNVNFSSLELSNTNIAYLIKDLLNEYDLKTENLTIEVTETADSISEKRMESNLEIFHELGFKLALDDFGTGYSNIERVLSMPFDYIKIDKSLLDHAKDSMINNILLRKNIEMLKECGYHIVVEGVEFDEQVKLLSDHNVDYIQGFYYSRPIPIEDFADLLRSSKNVRT